MSHRQCVYARQSQQDNMLDYKMRMKMCKKLRYPGVCYSNGLYTNPYTTMLRHLACPTACLPVVNVCMCIYYTNSASLRW